MNFFIITRIGQQIKKYLDRIIRSEKWFFRWFHSIHFLLEDELNVNFTWNTIWVRTASTNTVRSSRLEWIISPNFFCMKTYKGYKRPTKKKLICNFWSCQIVKFIIKVLMKTVNRFAEFNFLFYKLTISLLMKVVGSNSHNNITRNWQSSKIEITLGITRCGY